MSWTVIIDGKRRCIRCSMTKALCEFPSHRYTTRQGKRGRRFSSRCASCEIQRGIERRLKNPEEGAALSKAWRAKNPSKAAGDARLYRATPEGRRVKALLQRLRKARLRAGAANDDPAVRAVYAKAAEWQRLVSVCPIFKDPLLRGGLHVDHVIALARGGQHCAGNLQILPAILNCMKHAR